MNDGKPNPDYRHARVFKKFFVELEKPSTKYNGDKGREHLRGKSRPLSRAEIVVYLLIRFSADELGICSIKTASLCDWSGYSDRQVRRALEVLTERKLIVSKKRNGKAWLYLT